MIATSPIRPGGRNRIAHIDAALDGAYDAAEAQLGNKDDPLDEAIYIILSFQTDLPRLRQVWSQLRATYPTWQAVDGAPITDVSRVLRKGGLHRQKARSIKALLAAVRRIGGALSARSPSRVG
jgi:endonuclease III